MKNEFLIGRIGDQIVVTRHIPPRLSQRQALELAAWLVAMSDDGLEDFLSVHKALLEDPGTDSEDLKHQIPYEDEHPCRAENRVTD